MPAYEKKPMGGDDTDLYDSGGDASPEPKPEDKSPEEADKEKEAGQSALIPASVCPDMKPGESLVLKVKEVMDGQYLCEYEPEPKEKTQDEPTVKPPERDSEMSSMFD